MVLQGGCCGRITITMRARDHHQVSCVRRCRAPWLPSGLLSIDDWRRRLTRGMDEVQRSHRNWSGPEYRSDYMDPDRSLERGSMPELNPDFGQRANRRDAGGGTPRTIRTGMSECQRDRPVAKPATAGALQRTGTRGIHDRRRRMRQAGRLDQCVPDRVGGLLCGRNQRERCDLPVPEWRVRP
jgi:hypothetical protein